MGAWTGKRQRPCANLDIARSLVWCFPKTPARIADGKLRSNSRANSISWGFTLGEFKTTTVLRINENFEWTEHGELVIGARPPQKMMELKVRRSSR